MSINGEIRNIVVLGGGLAGSVLAYLLENAGYKVLLVEKEDEVGGGCAVPENSGELIMNSGRIFYMLSLARKKKSFSKNSWTSKYADFFPGYP